MRAIYPEAPARTLANAVIVEAFFAFAWFGWGQAGPPFAVSVVLGVGAVLSALVAAGGIRAAWRLRDQPSPLSGPAAGRRYGIIVGTEFGLAGVGAAILGVSGHAEFIPAWVCLVVGVHFVPLSRVFPGIGMVAMAIALSLVAVAAFAVGALTTVLPSTIAGLGAGLCLLGHSGSMLVGMRTARYG